MASHTQAGWTVFDKLYVFKGIVYIVTDHPSTVPDVQFIYSKALFIQPGAEEEAKRLPTKDEIQVISTKEARKLFGMSAQTIDGFTVCIRSYLFFCAPLKSLTSHASSLSMIRLNCK